MPRDLSKSEEMTSKNNRYSPFDRRLQLELPTPPLTPPSPVPVASPDSEERGHCYIRRCPVSETPMTLFHAKLVEMLHCKVEKKELELASDAETLTADEGSDSSNDSWSSRESDGSGALLPQPLDLSLPFQSICPRVVVLSVPQLEPLEEPMEIVVDDLPAPAAHRLPVLQPLAPGDADENDGDVSSESSSFWDSDDDEEIQRACQQDSDEESDEEEDGEYDDERYDLEPSSGRVNRPQVYRPEFYVAQGQSPAPPTQPLDFYWSAGLPAAQPLQVHPGQAHWAAGSPHSPLEYPIQAAYWTLEQLDQAAADPRHEAQSCWPAGQLDAERPVPESPREQSAQPRDSSVELMDQDDQELSAFVEAPRPYEPAVVAEQAGRTQLGHLGAARSPMQRAGEEREPLDYYYPRYGMRDEPGGVYFNNSDYLEEAFLAHPASRCNHCGSAIEPRREVVVARQPVRSPRQLYLPHFETAVPSTCTDFSIRHLLSSDVNRM